MPLISVSAFAPASIGNVSCGFDVFGMAIHEPGDEVTVSLAKHGEVRMKSITGDGGRLPSDAGRNTASVAVQAFLRHINSTNTGIDISLTKNLPLGSGMGSSAASAVAAVVATNALLGAPLNKVDLLPFVLEGEAVACGDGHADNAAPSLLGGLVLVRSLQPLDVISIPTPPDLVCVLVHPHIEIKTRDARKVLKEQISLRDGVAQWANTAALVAGMMKSDYELIGRSLVDVVAEPYRAPLIPAFYDVRQAALQAGALGMGISGSGPTVFALCRGREVAQRVSHAMAARFASINLESDRFVSGVNATGARIVSAL
jgi:homoserine kinase